MPKDMELLPSRQEKSNTAADSVLRSATLVSDVLRIIFVDICDRRIYFVIQSTLHHGRQIMNEREQHLQNLAEIRQMMERSSKVLTLSGLSGVSAGLVALAGVLMALWIQSKFSSDELVMAFAVDAVCVLILALVLAAVFSTRMARKKNLPIWTATTNHLILDLSVPLGAGGMFCLALMNARIYELIPGAMLVFYGLALVSGSKYALKEIRYFGMTQLVLGCIALFTRGQELTFWAIGFGAMHIVYGVWMYVRYEK
jgi:hypothetical protein